MKTNHFLLSGIMGIALAGFVLTGCHKDSTSPTTTAADSDITAAQDDANGQDAATDSKNVSDEAVEADAHGASRHGAFNFGYYFPHSQVKWSLDTSTVGVEDTLYIIFPSTPTLCYDGRYREGEIIVYWPRQAGYLWQAYSDSGVTINESFRGYASGYLSSSMNTISGTRTWTNEGSSQQGYENWGFSANLKITYSDGEYATWTSTRNNSLVYESSLNTWFYEVTGSASGTSRTGVAYTIDITSPLYVTAIPAWAGGCGYIESGDVTITRTGKPYPLTVNFGTLGSCNAVKTATIDGKTYTFIMW